MVYVLNTDGKPLMPTERHGKVRRLLKEKKAKVIRRTPFTIKLLYDTPDIIQELTLGIDTGSAHIGSAVYSENGEILYTAKTEIRNDITTTMKERATNRRNRRNRKTRYRQCKLAKADDKDKDQSWVRYKKLRKYMKIYKGVERNRKNLSPTLRSKIHSHVKEIEFVKSILPIKRIVLETGTFDPHLMKNPALHNPEIAKWGYQKGSNYGFANTKAKVLDRDGYKCHICKTKKHGIKLEVHHIIFRSNGGSDDESNLITLCHDCHVSLHEYARTHNGETPYKLKGKKKSQLKHATQMNIIRNQLLTNYYPEAIETFGYVTKENRFNLGIEKDHYLDACVIASGGKSFSIKSDILLQKDIAKGTHALEGFVKHPTHDKGEKGGKSFARQLIAPSETTKNRIINNGLEKYNGVVSLKDQTPFKGLTSNCKVSYFGKEYYVMSVDKKGYAQLKDIDGNKIDFSFMGKGNKTPKLCNIKRLSSRKTRLQIIKKS